MGHDPDREPPFFFMKPANSIVPNSATIPFPQATRDLHHEIELVVALGKGGANIAVEKALDHVWGYGVGPVRPGDKLEGHVDGVGDLTITYAG
jgi:fumarylpyruvate hydrolase